MDEAAALSKKAEELQNFFSDPSLGQQFIIGV
jgi:hypothetical protein